MLVIKQIRLANNDYIYARPVSKRPRLCSLSIHGKSGNGEKNRQHEKDRASS